jgi:WD40 repeat protein
LARDGSYDKTIRLWDLASGKELRVLAGHLGAGLTLQQFGKE